MRNPWRFPWRSGTEAVPWVKNRSGRELMWAEGWAYVEVVSQEGAGGITGPKQASLGTLSRWWQKAGAEMQMETRRCSVKRPLVTSTNIPLDKASHMAGCRHSGRSSEATAKCVTIGKSQEVKPFNSSHGWAHCTTPAFFFFCFLVKEESSSH